MPYLRLYPFSCALCQMAIVFYAYPCWRDPIDLLFFCSFLILSGRLPYFKWRGKIFIKGQIRILFVMLEKKMMGMKKPLYKTYEVLWGPYEGLVSVRLYLTRGKRIEFYFSSKDYENYWKMTKISRKCPKLPENGLL